MLLIIAMEVDCSKSSFVVLYQILFSCQLLRDKLAVTMENTLFGDIFKVIQIDPDGKKFDKGIFLKDF